jgi:two-component system sensor histidine kinase GlrK
MIAGAIRSVHSLKLANFYYPKSFLKLLLLGFVVVSAPLVVALINAALSVQRLAGMSESVVDQAAQSARGSRLLMEQVLSMERVVRQYVILDDAGLLDDYEKVRASFKRTTSELSLLPLDDLQLAEVNRTIDKEQALYELLERRPGEAAERRQLVEGYVDLSGLAKGVLSESGLLIDREIGRMREAAALAQRSLLVQLLAAFPLGLAIAAVFAFLIARPIRQLDRAIRRLGAADFTAGVRVQGPTDLEFLGERLDWLRVRLAALEEQKTRFLRHVSHELKTPLTALREGSDLLADGAAGPVTAAQREIVAILQSNSAHLQRLIEDLLNYQRAVASDGHLAVARVDLADIARAVIETHKLDAARRSVTLALHALPAIALVDQEKLRVVIDNLVSNAIKFSPEGETVRVVVRPDEPGVVIEVSDQGVGVAQEDRDKVFDWFFQGARPSSGRVKGSGLGLAIARELVQAHGGTIEVGDGPGGRFRVVVPQGGPPGDGEWVDASS